MDVKICDRCGRICAQGVSYYVIIQTARKCDIEVDLCCDCRDWLMKEFNKKIETKEEEE